MSPSSPSVSPRAAAVEVLCLWATTHNSVDLLFHSAIEQVADIDRGLKRFTFNFDFVRRNARRKENFINQDMNSKEVKKELNVGDGRM